MEHKFESILLYLEDCCVNQRGWVEAKRMNEQDILDIKKLKELGMIIEFKRIKFEVMQKLHKDVPTKTLTHFVELSDDAYEQAHLRRKERAKRMIAQRKKDHGY